MGVNPLPLLTTKNDIMRGFYFELRDLMLEKREIQDKNFATLIVDEIIKRIK